MKSLVVPNLDVLVQFVILYFLMTKCCQGEGFNDGDRPSKLWSLFAKDSVVSFPRLVQSFIRPVSKNLTTQHVLFLKDNDGDRIPKDEEATFKIVTRDSRDDDGGDDDSQSWSRFTNYFSSFLSSTENAWEYVESVRHRIHRLVNSTRQQLALSSDRQSTPEKHNSYDQECDRINIDHFCHDGLVDRPIQDQNVSLASTAFENILMSVVKLSGMLVTIQSASLLVRSNAVEVAALFMSEESINAMNTIRSIFSTVQSQHGVVIDIFEKYKRMDILVSVLALSRLQQAAHYFEFRRHERDINGSQQLANDFEEIVREEPNLLGDLAHYSIYATAAYGWKMDFALRQRLHLGGNVQALLRRTGISSHDIIYACWHSKTHHPAYFCVRDAKRKAIVVSIRGTWTAHDVLTDLCCASDEFYVTGSGPYDQGRIVSGHHGMLLAALSIQDELEPILSEVFRTERKSDYKLILVGHSMGGGVAALLGTLLENRFLSHQIRVYTYGPPCLSPMKSILCRNIYSVINDGDPFSCISLGHVADISVALSQLCEDPLLRNQILFRTNVPKKDMDETDLEWCYDTMEQLRASMTAEKLFPPGKLFLISDDRDIISSLALSSKSKAPSVRIRKVDPRFFQDLIIGAKMFDLARHFPSVYESVLRQLASATPLV